MRTIALNGSPRKRWNTATLLKHALNGAAAHVAEKELVHLYDRSYKGANAQTVNGANGSGQGNSPVSMYKC